ncbi:MAG: UDPGP type 1 family protein [Roseburia sp.]|uniref:UTP--glucose-1-phosphate uridylyltransferase n=1 Tax=Roseburia sp. 831b TaxID=1261635 RepID=UPI0009524F9E|nr:UDPGP type 1 family protein [Roseburia sp. 831b]MCI5920271.1 UDPGP type 1 family protein [Roseburia sp.]WVK71969.1 UDPGP type 1 family protein [Roseburia sp. 831b]
MKIDKKQTYLLHYLDKLSGEQRSRMEQTLEEIDWSLLDKLQHKENKRGVFAPLGAMNLQEIAEQKDEFEKIGLEAIRAGKVGAVLLAGGQGTRLGFEHPKGTFNIGLTHELFIFEQQMKNLMEVIDKAGVFVPLYIMTSEKNNEETIQFWEKHSYFGYDKSYVRFFVQEMVPAVDYEGRIYMEEPDKIAMSPNGNGGWFSSMEKCGLMEDLHKRNIEWLNVFAVDNVLQRIADPVFIGATLKAGCQSGAKVVRKADPYEKVGALCLEDGKPSIVEYYELTKEMAEATNEKGDLEYGFGVILNYLFRLDKLEEIVDNKMPLHVVEKKIPYIDLEGNHIKPEQPNGYKFETLVLDMVHLMENCLSFEVDRAKEFAPIKNKTGVDSIDTARELLKLNGIEL